MPGFVSNKTEMPHLRCCFSNHRRLWISYCKEKTTLKPWEKAEWDSNCREGENNSLIRKANQINKLVFISHSKRVENFRSYQCTSSLGGVSKEKEVSGVLLLSIIYHDSRFPDVALCFVFCQGSVVCTCGFEWHRSRAQCHPPVLNSVVSKTCFCWWDTQHNAVLCHFIE